MLELIEILKNGGTVEAGTYEKLISMGLLPMHLTLHLQMYEKYKEYYRQYIEEDKRPYHTLAITHTSDDFGVSETTVKRAIRLLEYRP